MYNTFLGLNFFLSLFCVDITLEIEHTEPDIWRERTWLLRSHHEESVETEIMNSTGKDGGGIATFHENIDTKPLRQREARRLYPRIRWRN
jgi:hypothetical protein